MRRPESSINGQAPVNTTRLAPAPGIVQAAERLGGEIRPCHFDDTHYIVVELGQGEKVSVIPSPYGGSWKVCWPWGDSEHRYFHCRNLKAVEDRLADLCTTPRPNFHKGD